MSIWQAEIYKLIGVEINARIVETYPELGGQTETAAPESQGAAVGKFRLRETGEIADDPRFDWLSEQRRNLLRLEHR